MNQLNIPKIVYEIKSHHVTLTLTNSIKEAEDTYRSSPSDPKFKAAFALNTATGFKTPIAFVNVASPK